MMDSVDLLISTIVFVIILIFVGGIYLGISYSNEVILEQRECQWYCVDKDFVNSKYLGKDSDGCSLCECYDGKIFKMENKK